MSMILFLSPFLFRLSLLWFRVTNCHLGPRNCLIRFYLNISHFHWKFLYLAAWWTRKKKLSQRWTNVMEIIDSGATLKLPWNQMKLARFEPIWKHTVKREKQTTEQSCHASTGSNVTVECSALCKPSCPRLSLTWTLWCCWGLHLEACVSYELSGSVEQGWLLDCYITVSQKWRVP